MAFYGGGAPTGETTRAGEHASYDTSQPAAAVEAPAPAGPPSNPGDIVAGGINIGAPQSPPGGVSHLNSGFDMTATDPGTAGRNPYTGLPLAGIGSGQTVADYATGQYSYSGAALPSWATKLVGLIPGLGAMVTAISGFLRPGASTGYGGTSPSFRDVAGGVLDNSAIAAPTAPSTTPAASPPGASTDPLTAILDSLGGGAGGGAGGTDPNAGTTYSLQTSTTNPNRMAGGLVILGAIAFVAYWWFKHRKGSSGAMKHKEGGVPPEVEKARKETKAAGEATHTDIEKANKEARAAADKAAADAEKARKAGAAA